MVDNAVARSWVMLADMPHAFIRLPRELLLYQSPPRTTFNLSCSSKHLAFNSPTGVVHLTNQRIIYTPTERGNDFESFSCPIDNIHDYRVSAPFFGPNVWTAIVQPVPNGGIVHFTPAVELKLVFKDGGAFDFHSFFERLKYRKQQALESSSEAQVTSGIHIDDLPAYADSGATHGLVRSALQMPYNTGETTEAPPNEPPPGYEEVPRTSVAMAMEDSSGQT
ncbi:hypothetical protein EDC01DRAFT_616964 [Geopyxis carbonaria]|nr:hypothetical protein EDC01DRAFT_616964 [Geopyxis carbonaria]